MADRDERGRFLPDTTVGKETRFAPGNDASRKYDDSICDEMIAWFNEQAEENADYPTFERFARKIAGVTHDTLRIWAKEHARFSSAYAACKDIQREVLAVRTLGRVYDPTFAKFLAVNNLGMVDQSAVTVQGDEDKPLSVNISIRE